MASKIKINRAPVMTLWAVVVAERLGYPKNTALTLGKAVAGLNAQSKGQRLGIFEPSTEEKSTETAKEKSAPAKSQAEAQTIRLLGRQVLVQHTDKGLLAEESGQPMDPASVERYLKQKFKDRLEEVRQAMQTLAESVEPAVLEKKAYTYYEEFRPEIPEGKRGWGAAGELDLEKIRSLKPH
jgi:hypothetical protein